MLVIGLFAASCGGGGSSSSSGPATPPAPEIGLDWPLQIQFVEVAGERAGSSLPVSEALLKVVSPYAFTIEVTFEGKWGTPDMDEENYFPYDIPAEDDLSLGESFIAIPLPASGYDDIRVMVVATAHYQGRSSPPSGPARARYWRPSSGNLQLDPLPLETGFVPRLQVKVAEGVTGEVIVSDQLGNYVTKLLSGAEITSVGIETLTTGDLKVEVRPDGYQSYVERFHYDSFNEQVEIPLIEPEIVPETSGDAEVSWDMVQISGSTWLPNFGKLTIELPDGLSVGLVTDGEVLLITLHDEDSYITLLLQAEDRTASSVGGLATLVKVDEADYILSISDATVEMLEGNGDPLILSSVVDSESNPLTKLMVASPATRLAFPGTYTYEKAAGKVLPEVEDKSKNFTLFAFVGGSIGLLAAGPGGALLGMSGGAIIASATGNEVGLAEELSVWANKSAEQAYLSYPEDQRFVVLHNPALNLLVRAGNIAYSVLGEEVWAIAPVEPSSLEVRTAAGKDTLVTDLELEKDEVLDLDWVAVFGDRVDALRNWRSSAVSAWVDDTTLTRVERRVDGGLRVTALDFGETQLYVDYNSPAPFNWRDPLSMALPLRILGMSVEHYVGLSTTFTAARSGYVYLRFVDDVYWDNSGSWVLVVNGVEVPLDPLKSEWVSTGIYVNAGDTVTITWKSGDVRVSNGQPNRTPPEGEKATWGVQDDSGQWWAHTTSARVF